MSLRAGRECNVAGRCPSETDKIHPPVATIGFNNLWTFPRWASSLDELAGRARWERAS